jgi:hypothetical protein
MTTTCCGYADGGSRWRPRDPDTASVAPTGRLVYLYSRESEAEAMQAKVLTADEARRVDAIAAGLTVPERVLLFCLASGTDWLQAGVPTITVQHLLVRNLAERRHAAQLVLTEQGRAVLAALLRHDGID